jgi:NAD(P)-dependent dehydrogenase (short-subunit alcohol dehydrogenase family)
MADKVAIVTGASSGIGLLTTIELAQAGFRVIGSMRNLDRREQLDQAVAGAGLTSKIDVRQLDVVQFDTLPGFVDSVVGDFGRIDVLVNNAGFSMVGFAEDLSLAELRAQLDTNFFGHVAATQAVLPVMRRQQSGHVVMLSSIGGLCGQISLAAYAASKFALEGWSEALRLETNSSGIKVVLVEPGSFQTAIWDRNVHLAKRILDGSSSNPEGGKRARNWAQKIKKQDPVRVARLIVRVVQDPNPRLRYLIGPDAWALLWAKRLMPWKQYESWIAHMMKSSG